MNSSQLWLLIQNMLEASLTTLLVFGLTLLFALPLGLVVALGRMSRFKPLSWLIQIYLLVMRGTPLILQLIFFYFVPDQIGRALGVTISLDRFQAAILAFSLNYAAYFAEIYRGGIEGVPVGQREAANVLGFSKSHTFFRIVLPQVVKKILPPMSNEFMTLVKDTSLAQVIGVAEIFQLANTATSKYFSVEPIFVAGAFYLVMNAVVNVAFKLAEKRLDYYH